jgi:hypothetical protein
MSENLKFTRLSDGTNTRHTITVSTNEMSRWDMVFGEHSANTDLQPVLLGSAFVTRPKSADTDL